MRRTRGEVSVEATQPESVRRSGELDRESNIVARKQPMSERRLVGEEREQPGARGVAIDLRGFFAALDARDRREQISQRAVRHGAGRRMEREHMHIDAQPFELSDLVDDERLGQAGKHLGDIPDAMCVRRRRAGHAVLL